MEIKISNKNGIILKTANKLCTENITLILDESLFEPSGPVLTLICDSSVINNSNYTYSIDSGSTWNTFTDATIKLTAEKIRFSGYSTGMGGYGYNIHVGTSSGYSDIYAGTGDSADIAITTDTTLYISGAYNSGGAD